MVVNAPINLSSENLFDIINTTRAMRRLKPDPVPDDLIVRILEAGTRAPNAANSTWPPINHCRMLNLYVGSKNRCPWKAASCKGIYEHLHPTARYKTILTGAEV